MLLNTGLNVGVAAGWVTFLTVSDIIGLLGGVVGLTFTLLRISSWFSERNKRNLEIEMLKLKKESLLKECKIKNTPDE